MTSPYNYSLSYFESPPSKTTSDFSTSPSPNSSNMALTPDQHSLLLRQATRISLDAPTQPRRYLTPSATSKKEVPAFYSRMYSPSDLLPDEEDELAEDRPGPNATDQEKISYKRRQNTIAARRSRQRKRDELEKLQRRVEFLEKESQKWEFRTKALKDLLNCHGIPAPQFSD
ncbi:hypothetical protein BDN72DRAFT_844662 [Pluteus cervinus]|uniref:Uncharacterized protein n=1 Tax=Pluteus cervinus TaxID=181527 RepID=A0ACD3AJV0_9AGAR|nr:hypothetical protein BDN72DRAFT_844662 [Pluteus cervinus]